MTPQLLKEILDQYPPLNEDKLDRRIKYIDSMLWFYENKLESPELEERFKEKFKNFVSALHYSKTVMIKHQQLVKRLRELDIEINKPVL